MNSLGTLIRKYRLYRNLSQMELEILVNLSSVTISRIENEQTNPTKETLLKIAGVLKLNFLEKAELFGINISKEELMEFIKKG